MLVIRQKFIFREDLKNNPNILYVFGDNLERIGFGGQALEMRGEPNAFGIATKRSPHHGSAECYFHDSDTDCLDIVCDEFDRLEGELKEFEYHQTSLGPWKKHKWDAVVIPLDGIGTGLSKLPLYAPKLLSYINVRLEDLRRL